MYAALRGTTISAFLFEGTEREYDEWFDNLIAEDCEDDGFGNLVWDAVKNIHGDVINSVTIVPYETVILHNERMDKLNHVLNFYMLTIDEFEQQFFGIGEGLAALKEDCVEYFCFEEENISSFNIGNTRVPPWVRVFVLQKFKDLNFDSFGIFIRNRIGMVEFVQNGSFTSCYEY